MCAPCASRSCTTCAHRSAGASLACFDSYGGKCKANTTGCPCQYLSVYKSSSGAVTYAANNANNGGGKCVVCPPAPVPVTLPNPPPGVIYQPCASSNFALGGVANTPLPTSGSWTGLAYCASVPNSPGYWVGDGNECVAMPQHYCCVSSLRVRA